MSPEYFELTEDHLKLLSELNIDHQYGAYEGAPGADEKRPFGNSDVWEDIVDILGLGYKQDENGNYSRAEMDYLQKIFKQVAVAMSIVLQARTFKPGRYVRVNYGKWCLSE